RRLLLGDLLICSMLLVGAVIVTSYSKGSAVEAPRIQTDAQARQVPVTVTLTTDRATHHRGQPLKFTITAHNTTATPQTLQFFSGQSFDISVRPVAQQGSQADPVWMWSHGKLFTMDMPTRTIAPGASYTWTAVWDQTNNNDVTVTRGQYQVDSHLATTPILNAAPV